MSDIIVRDHPRAGGETPNRVIVPGPFWKHYRANTWAAFAKRYYRKERSDEKYGDDGPSGQCDCCGKVRGVRRVWSDSVYETWACEECCLGRRKKNPEPS